MTSWKIGVITFLGVMSLGQAEEIERVSLPKPKDMNRAEIVAIDTVKRPKAVLVLCPGANGNGEGLIRQKAWRDFAIKNDLGLAGLHFESPGQLLSQCEGYYKASEGSGDVLLDGIKKIYGKDLPLMLYGFSGGSYFISRFIEWKPGRVWGWCALGAGLFDDLTHTGNSPPGIVACGEVDPRLGGSLIFFKQGRALGRPWLWVELKKAGHVMSPQMEEFSRAYFEALMDHKEDEGIWVDVDTKKELSQAEAEKSRVLSGWLPEKKLMESWRNLHEFR